MIRVLLSAVAVAALLLISLMATKSHFSPHDATIFEVQAGTRREKWDETVRKLRGRLQQLQVPLNHFVGGPVKTSKHATAHPRINAQIGFHPLHVSERRSLIFVAIDAQNVSTAATTITALWLSAAHPTSIWFGVLCDNPVPHALLPPCDVATSVACISDRLRYRSRAEGNGDFLGMSRGEAYALLVTSGVAAAVQGWDQKLKAAARTLSHRYRSPVIALANVTSLSERATALCDLAPGDALPLPVKTVVNTTVRVPFADGNLLFGPLDALLVSRAAMDRADETARIWSVSISLAHFGFSVFALPETLLAQSQRSATPSDDDRATLRNALIGTNASEKYRWDARTVRGFLARVNIDLSSKVLPRADRCRSLS